MSLKPLPTPQLALLLELLPGAARLEQDDGQLLAQNEAAAQAARPQWHDIDLGEHWLLRFADLVPAAPSTSASPTAHLPDDLNALVRGMAHEIRNPLSAILTAIDLIRDDPAVGEETSMLLDVVRKEARRMNRILTEFGAYVKPPNPHAQAFDLAHAARHAAQEMQRESVHKVEIEDELSPTLMACADETQIRQVLTRLLQNAAQAMPQGGRLHLSSESSSAEGKPRVTLCIEDSGPGFSQESFKQAFQPFYSTKPHETGLGLSIARAAVEAAGGRIWIDVSSPQTSSPPSSSGARVCLELPGAPEPS